MSPQNMIDKSALRSVACLMRSVTNVTVNTGPSLVFIASTISLERIPMAKTFTQMVQEVRPEVPGVSPVKAQQRLQKDADALLLAVRDAGNIPADEKAPDMVKISLGTLPIRADLEVPDPPCPALLSVFIVPDSAGRATLSRESGVCQCAARLPRIKHPSPR